MKKVAIVILTLIFILFLPSSRAPAQHGGFRGILSTGGSMSIGSIPFTLTIFTTAARSSSGSASALSSRPRSGTRQDTRTRSTRRFTPIRPTRTRPWT